MTIVESDYAVAVAPTESSPLISGKLKSGKLPWVRRLTYGSGEGGLAILQVIKGFFFNSFLLEVAMIDAYYAGLILLLAKLVDAISDVIIGDLSDHTKSRFGRRRSWILFLSVPLAITYFFLWYVPSFEGVRRIVYFQFLTVGVSVLYTGVAVPYGAMTAELTDDYDERTTLTTIRMVFLMGVGLIATFGHAKIIELFVITKPNGSVVTDFEKGYLLSGFIFACVMIIPLYIAFFGTAWSNRGYVKDTDQTRHGPGFFRGLLLVVQNKAFITVMLVYFFSQIAVQFVQNNLNLYTKYVARAEKNFPYVLLTLQASVLIFVLFWGLVASRVGKKPAYFMGGTLLMVVFVFLYLLPTDKPFLLFPLAALSGMGVSAALLLPLSMLPDVIELDELKTGVRREGIFYSLFLFFQKAGLSIGLAMSNFVLGAVGYTPPVENPLPEDPSSSEFTESSDEVKSVVFALRILVGVIPATITLFSFLILYFYPITKESHNQTRALLKAKREGSNYIAPS